MNLASVDGVLAGKANHDDIVDVAVVEGAVRRHDAASWRDDQVQALSRWVLGHLPDGGG